MNRWVSHAIAWSFLAVGGVLFYVVLEKSALKGLGLAAGSVLIDIGILYFHEDVKRAREEDEEPAD